MRAHRHPHAGMWLSDSNVNAMPHCRCLAQALRIRELEQQLADERAARALDTAKIGFLNDKVG